MRKCLTISYHWLLHLSCCMILAIIQIWSCIYHYTVILSSFQRIHTSDRTLLKLSDSSRIIGVAKVKKGIAILSRMYWSTVSFLRSRHLIFVTSSPSLYPDTICAVVRPLTPRITCLIKIPALLDGEFSSHLSNPRYFLVRSAWWASLLFCDDFSLIAML